MVTKNIITELDNYLDAFGTFGAYKSDPDDPVRVEHRDNPRRVKRDYTVKMAAKSLERQKILAKRAKTAKLWTRAELMRPDGTATRYYDWETYEREDGWHLFIRRQTERKPAVRVRKALDRATVLEREAR